MKESEKSDVNKTPICGCCLGTQSNEVNEIVECDGCGISVHEACYGIVGAADDHEEHDDDAAASTVSSASTEPWFCEPCRAGVTTSPPCELCPNVGGIYKRTDAGRWVHLVCALYTPGVAFAEPERVACVTVFEMSYAQFGRKACFLCADTKTARTGVCINCDAGMCKQFFHASCGHAGGLLSEPAYSSAGDPATATAVATADHYLGHCKIHTDRTVIRKRKQNFLSHLLQTRARMEVIERRAGLMVASSEEDESADQRIIRKLRKNQKRYLAERAKKPEPWLPTKKLPRLITTSSSAIRKFEAMGELQGLSVVRQRQQEQDVLSVMDVKRRWHVPAGLNIDYVAYYFDRENRISDLRKTLEDHIKVQSGLKDREATTRPNFDLVNRKFEIGVDTAKELRTSEELYRTLLSAICPAKALPKAPKPKESSGGIGAASQAVPSSGGGKSSSSESVSVNECGVCAKTSAQHLMAHCDTCKKHYHLGCLNPPLTRMPKKTQLYGWECSQCAKDTSSEDEKAVDVEAPRQKRQAAKRAASSRANSGEFEEAYFQDDDKVRYRKPVRKENQREVPRGNEQTSPPMEAAAAAAAYTNGDGNKDSSGANDNAAHEAMRRSLIEQTMKKKHKKHKKHKKKRKRDAEVEDDDDEDENDGSGAVDEEDFKEDPVVIEEQDGDTCVVRIEPKPVKKAKKDKDKNGKIKLKIKTSEGMRVNSAAAVAASTSADSIPTTAPAAVLVAAAAADDATGGSSSTIYNSAATAAAVVPNGGGCNSSDAVMSSCSVDPFDFEDELQPPPPPPPPVAAKKRKRSSAGPGQSAAAKVKDVRTRCDVCQREGSNENLVRCDVCKKCFHFKCLLPPVKKSPKVAGYSWHCNDCDPSDRDSDWHLD